MELRLQLELQCVMFRKHYPTITRYPSKKMNQCTPRTPGQFLYLVEHQDIYCSIFDFLQVRTRINYSLFKDLTKKLYHITQVCQLLLFSICVAFTIVFSQHVYSLTYIHLNWWMFYNFVFSVYTLLDNYY